LGGSEITVRPKSVIAVQRAKRDFGFALTTSSAFDARDLDRPSFIPRVLVEYRSSDQLRGLHSSCRPPAPVLQSHPPQFQLVSERGRSAAVRLIRLGSPVASCAASFSSFAFLCSASEFGFCGDPWRLSAAWHSLPAAFAIAAAFALSAFRTAVRLLRAFLGQIPAAYAGLCSRRGLLGSLGLFGRLRRPQWASPSLLFLR
jgi:hypothetical protein